MSKIGQCDDTGLSGVQRKVSEIWLRARSNAFAHREAAGDYRSQISKYFFHQVLWGVGSILLVLLAYVSTDVVSPDVVSPDVVSPDVVSPNVSFESSFPELPLYITWLLSQLLLFITWLLSQLLLFITWLLSQIPLIFTLLSVVAGAISLVKGVMQNHHRYELKYMMHDHNQHSYLFIAQRAREVQWPDIDAAKAIAILEDLERDFQILKVRGPEPNDQQFERANKILNKLRSGRENEMQSFGGAPKPNGQTEHRQHQNDDT